MRIDILTIFPKMFRGPFDESIVKRAVDSGLVSIHLHDIRKWAKDRHKTVDDYPYGGGPGMVMEPAVVFAATAGGRERRPPRPRAPGDGRDQHRRFRAFRWRAGRNSPRRHLRAPHPRRPGLAGVRGP